MTWSPGLFADRRAEPIPVTQALVDTFKTFDPVISAIATTARLTQEQVIKIDFAWPLLSFLAADRHS